MELYCGNCLEIMKNIKNASIDAIITDLPYGVTKAKWDCEIDLDALWEQYHRITRKNSPIILFSSQPFTSKLIASNLKEFKYCWYWKKDAGTGFLNSKKQPLRIIEEICVFYREQVNYSPQTIPCSPRKSHLARTNTELSNSVKSAGETPIPKVYNERFPTNLLEYKRVGNSKRLHSTQKPIELLEYLLKTYTKEGDVVLDNTMGSGSTGAACKNLNREFIGIEIDKKVFEVAKNRLMGA